MIGRKTSNILASLAFLLLFTAPVYAQGDMGKESRYRIGIEGGLLLSEVDDPIMLVSKSGNGYNFGPYFDYYIGEFLKLRLAGHFESRKFGLENGTQLIVDDSGYVGKSSYYDNKEKYTVNFLTIPLSIIFEKGSDKLKLFVQGTFYYSLLLNSKQESERYVYISAEDAGKLFFDEFPEFNAPGIHFLDPEIKTFNSSDMGISAHIGVKYNINRKMAFSFSPGFTLSFSNVWDNPSRLAKWSRMYRFTAGISYLIH